ncbi:MAG TPA: biotin synthase BioB [Dissulfurispiraceae bacterium]|nr:biotin synthase BioB [Dissulfurispiraceae bacterium]
MLTELEQKIAAGKSVSKKDAKQLAELPASHLPDLLAASNRLRIRRSKDTVELCAIVNAKSGLCPEHCSYCAQSAKSRTGVSVYPLITRREAREKAQQAKEGGVLRFSIVSSGRKPAKKDLRKIAFMLSDIRALGLHPCASLGLLDRDELGFLHDAGLERYHCNIETSERFFPSVCTAHTFSDKLKTIEAAKDINMSVCSGGIFGMGETWDDRVDMALTLRQLDVDSAPINFLNPIAGTPLADRPLMHPFDALKAISLFRFLLPDKAIRICGGRAATLGEFAAMIFMAGADSLMTGDYLTTPGQSYEDDLRLLSVHRLHPVRPNNLL